MNDSNDGKGAGDDNDDYGDDDEMKMIIDHLDEDDDVGKH